MIEQLRYINHMNESLEFGKEKLFVNENDLHNFAWEITSKNEKISGFKKGIASYAIPIILKCNSEEEGIALRNKMFEVFEKDVLSMQYGRFLIGDYYLKCYVTESSKSDYTINNGYMLTKIVVKTDVPYWIREEKITFGYDDKSSEGGLDYDMDYPIDYLSDVTRNSFYNNDFVSSNFVMNIYGSAVNPSIILAGHEYKVNVTVGSNEYLTIDSVNKTIKLIKIDGTEENCFNFRNRESYIFEKIPVGKVDVSRDSNFRFDIILLEERGEPKWT